MYKNLILLLLLILTPAYLFAECTEEQKARMIQENISASIIESQCGAAGGTTGELVQASDLEQTKEQPSAQKSAQEELESREDRRNERRKRRGEAKGNHRIILGLGLAGGTYTDTSSSAVISEMALSGAVVQLPRYDYVFDSGLLLGARLLSYSVSGTENVTYGGYLFELGLEYSLVGYGYAIGYEWNLNDRLSFAPAFRIGSGSAEATATVSYSGTLLASSTLTGTGSLAAIELPFIWQKGNSLIGVQYDILLGGSDLGTAGTERIDLDYDLQFVYGWHF